MTHAEMEEAINNCDRRLLAIEQILPTLATKTDLERFATKADLERFATKADLERFATKVDLERVTRELRGEIADARRETRILTRIRAGRGSSRGRRVLRSP